MKQELDDLLCNRYPKIFRDRHASMYESCMCWGFECGDGWFDIIDTICSQIQAYIDRENVEQVVATQVKEKFGTLRFYFDGGDVLTANIAQAGEETSSTTCEECGKFGILRTTNPNWMRTHCDACEKEYQLKRGK